MKRKVLYVITKSNWGGAQRYVYDLATSLPREEFDVAVAFGQPGRLAQELQKAGVATHPILSLQRDISIIADIKSFFELWRLFLRLKPNVVHLNSSKAGGVGALAARIAGVPKVIFTSHGLAWDEDRGPLVKFAIYLASQLTFALCHTVIAISQDTNRRAKGSTLVYNGLSSIGLVPRTEARRALGVPQEGLIVGAIGELTRNKGYRYLAEAVKKVKTSAQYVIISPGEDKAALEEQIQKDALPIHLAGFIPDAARLLSAFDIFVMPSVKEGLPYVLIEAGNAALPVIGSKIPGITDVVGDAGILVPAKDPAALAQALEQLLTNDTLRHTLGKKLQARVVQEFSLEQMVRNTVALYA